MIPHVTGAKEDNSSNRNNSPGTFVFKDECKVFVSETSNDSEEEEDGTAKNVLSVIDGSSNVKLLRMERGREGDL